MPIKEFLKLLSAKKMLKIPPAQNWHKIVSRGQYPILLVYELNQGLLNMHKITGLKIKMKNYCRLSGASYLYEPEWQKYVREISKVLKKNPARTLIWLKKYRQETEKLFLLIKKINKKLKTREFSQAELKKMFTEYEKQIQIFHRWIYLPFLMDEALAVELYDRLNYLKAASAAIPEIIKRFSVSPKMTLHKKREIELWRLIRELKKSDYENKEKLFRVHVKKWTWVNSWGYIQFLLTPEKLDEEIKPLIKKDPLREISKIFQQQKRSLAGKRKLLNKFTDSKLKIYAKILSEYNYWHSVKMEELSMANYLIRPLFEKLGKYHKLNFKQFIELSAPEILHEKINLKTIRDRQRASGILMMNGRWNILGGNKLSKLEKLFQKVPKQPRELKGFVAYPGKVRGRVVIVKAGNVDISKIKIKRGSILVASMTTTNMVPLVKKAAAIVTDEGGLLCHASIISRELKIPCIIGTKFATKVLHYDDLVEVDANNGVVKILK